jgi:hypothetical protein
MDYINNPRREDRVFDGCDWERHNRHHQPPERSHDCHYPRPNHGQVFVRDVLWRFALRQVGGWSGLIAASSTRPWLLSGWG